MLAIGEALMRKISLACLVPLAAALAAPASAQQAKTPPLVIESQG